MNYKKIIPAAIGLYLLFLVVLAPAAWWLKLVALPPQVQLGPVSGTLWQGQVQAVSFNGYVLQQVNWQLKPWALFTGKLALSLDIGQIRQTTLPYAKAQLAYGFSGLELESSQLRLPVEPIIPLLKLPLPFVVFLWQLLRFETIIQMLQVPELLLQISRNFFSLIDFCLT